MGIILFEWCDYYFNCMDMVMLVVEVGVGIVMVCIVLFLNEFDIGCLVILFVFI